MAHKVKYSNNLTRRRSSIKWAPCVQNYQNIVRNTSIQALPIQFWRGSLLLLHPTLKFVSSFFGFDFLEECFIFFPLIFTPPSKILAVPSLERAFSLFFLLRKFSHFHKIHISLMLLFTINNIYWGFVDIVEQII